MEKKEIRVNGQLRASGENDDRMIEGYAIRFNEWSVDLGGFYEIIRPSAITQSTLDNADIIMNVNHDNEKMLARWKEGKGTLQLELREDGLYFMFQCPTTALGDEVLYNIRHENLTECSFCFVVGDKMEDENWYRDDEGILRREILYIKDLYDTSIVTKAAYPSTSVSARSEEVKHTVKEVDAKMESIDDKFKSM